MRFKIEDIKDEATRYMVASGLLFDDSKQYGGDELQRKYGLIIGLQRAPRYKIRAWIAEFESGKKLLLYDCGNDWWQIMKEIKRKKSKTSTANAKRIYYGKTQKKTTQTQKTKTIRLRMPFPSCQKSKKKNQR